MDAVPQLFAEPLEAAPAPGLFAQVVFNRPLGQALTYAVPNELASAVRVGQRVKAPLGRGNHLALGYVVELTSTAPASPARLKSIRTIVDEQPLLTPELLRLTRWLAEYYLCGWGQALDAAVPAGAKAAAGTRLRPFVQAVDEADLPPIPAKLSRKQLNALGVLREAGRAMEASHLAERAGCGLPVVWALVRHGFARRLVRRTEQMRSPITPTAQPVEPPLELNEEQAAALATIRGALAADDFKPFLLFGVTGSGKTEIYLQAIDAVVQSGRQAIVLVPEISLTPQTIRRFAGRFAQVAVLHSHLSAAERGLQWRRIASGEAQVVVGARSAIFAPVPRLGLVVVDEEHEGSFKQESTPRYNARDVAVRRAQLAKVPVILGSATPALESWSNANKGQYQLLTLAKRVGERPLPRVELIDLRREPPQRGRYRAIGPTMERAIHQTLQAGGQVILLLNRRGFDTYLFCAECGHVVKCRFCDVAMTHHRPASAASQGVASASAARLAASKAICHYCGYQTLPPAECPECRVGRIRFLGLGTEKLEAELAERFPGVPAQRMDSDTMRRGGSHARALDAFQEGSTRILFGTQMIAKGLDFPGVQLVGVIHADTALHLPDFRAAERTFQLLAQVAGRSGRGAQPGRVLVQSYTPEHPCIRLAAEHDYPQFARLELHYRQQHGYPPFRRLARLVIRSRNSEAARGFAETLGAALADGLSSSIRLLGPAEAPLTKLEGYYRHHCQLLSASAKELHDLIRKCLPQIPVPEGVDVAVDIDPMSLL